MVGPHVRTSFGSAAKLRLVALVALLTVFGGMFGFMAIENMNPFDALYMTVITLSTVGFSEVTPLTHAGRFFVVILIGFGVAIAASLAALMGQQVLEGHFQSLVTRRKMENRLKKMSGHYIIAGFGRVGRQVAKEFQAKGVPCVVIEQSETSADQIMAQGVVTMQGDATDDEVLLSAGIERAHTLISTLPEEAQNVYLTLTARYMNPKLKIIARADFEDGEKKLTRAGADHVIIPHVLGGIRMAKAALQPHVVDFMQMASMGDEGLLVEELLVPDDSSLVGKSLVDSKLKQTYGITIIGVKQPGARMNINPKAETILNGQDVIVMIGGEDDLERFGRDIGDR
ncbi:MAG: potassium channel protein [candidate division Zixibacteria bacterium]|nr:potassium channel protein [candidate division Zixibacteria bacterium]